MNATERREDPTMIEATSTAPAGGRLFGALLVLLALMPLLAFAVSKASWVS